MHDRNRYAGDYAFAKLASTVPELQACLKSSPTGGTTIDFADPVAVRLLNKALLLTDYPVDFWDIPPQALCPGIPGRLDYIHVLADLLSDGEQLAKPDRKGQAIRGLDIGTGSSLVYPILGFGEYGWQFVASDTNELALRAAGAIVKFNKRLTGKIELRHQSVARRCFTGIIRPDEYFDFSMCNPPFYESEAAALEAARLKWKKLGKTDTSGFNFGGEAHELWTIGGEPRFLRDMILESARFSRQIGWFSTLVSQKSYLKTSDAAFMKVKPTRTREITIKTGTKTRRFLAWGW